MSCKICKFFEIFLIYRHYKFIELNHLKMLLNLKIFVCVIIILILGMPVYGCKSDLKKQPIESAPEIEEEPSEEATPISEENEKEVRPNKEENEEEETAENQDEIKDYSNKTELVYACSYIGGNPGKLIIEVDL
ncbi:MAG: hypothetical protein ACQEP5_10090, partial [Actinomycetota bacterium]